MGETITITKQEYKELKEKAMLSEDLLSKLVRGLEDVKNPGVFNTPETSKNQRFLSVLEILREFPRIFQIS